MCGIVGYVGARDASDVILSGLKRLEYRGYDSAGIAVLGEDGQVGVRREAGKLDQLVSLCETDPLTGNIGIGHTRWATHGKPSRTNSHPHTSEKGRVVVVHNGIVENYAEIKDELMAEGVTFSSETDTEVIAHLMEKHLEAGEEYITAARNVFARLEGSSAVVMLSPEHPDRIVAARLGNAGGITLGLSDDELFIASDIPAILEYTRKMIFLENRQMVVIEGQNYAITDLSGNALTPEIHTIAWDPVSAAKGQYKHFMEKEIFDQPQALINTLRNRVNFESGEVTLAEMNLTEELVNKINKIFIVACGTSYISGLVGKFLIENFAGEFSDLEIPNFFTSI